MLPATKAFVNQNPDHAADEPRDWTDFAAHRPDDANAIDDDFTDGGVSGDLLNAIGRITDYLRRGDVVNAMAVASRWNFLINEHRERGMSRFDGEWPRPAA